MDPASLENDLSPPQRSRMVDFRFTDPVRFLFEHMQGDSNKSNSEKISNDEWSKDRNSATKVPQTIERNALSPSLKGSYQDLYSGENVFTRVTPGLDKPEIPKTNSSHTTTGLAGNNMVPENNPDPLPPVQNSTLERNNIPTEGEGNRQSSSTRTQEQTNNVPSKANTFTSLVFRASKLEAVANNLARHRLSGNSTPGRRQEQSSAAKTPILKPPPLTRRLASRAFRRPGKPPLPLTPSAINRNLQPSTPMQAMTTGTKPSTATNPTTLKQPTPPPAPDSESESQGTVNTEDSEQEDPLQTLLHLCKKGDWQGVEGLIKQFSKTGIPSTLVDPGEMYILAVLVCLIGVVVGSECDDCDPDQLCCEHVLTGEAKCCEYIDGVCCLHGNCCPEGFFCSHYSDKCFKIPKYMQKRQGYLGDKRPSFTSGRFHRCDENSFCVDSFCCPNEDGTYGCCPFKPAVCCKDKRCCEYDETCDESSDYCIMKEGITLLSEITRPAVYRRSPFFFQ